MALDLDKAVEIRDLIRQAKALGIPQERLSEIATQENSEILLRREVAQRKTLADLSWQDKNRAHAARRRRIAAAYLAGASLRQLAFLFGVLPETVAKLVAKELPVNLRSQIAHERTARGRRRDPIWTPSQVSAMLEAVDEERSLQKAVVATAAYMQEIAKGATEEDEDDPYLRDEAGTPAAKTGEGS